MIQTAFGVLAIALIMLAAMIFFLPVARFFRPRYSLRTTLLTKAEQHFLDSLDRANDGRWRIFCQVRVADVISLSPGLSGKAALAARGQINQKHFDFVLCTPGDLTIQAAIELDDRSHQRSDRQKRDKFLDSTAKNVGLPLIRFPVRQSYDHGEIRKRIEEALIATVQ